MLYGKKETPACLKAAALLAFFLVFVPGTTDAEEGGVQSSSTLELQLSTMPEAKVRFIQQFVFPFLAGQGPLTRDNNIAAVLSADVTPISVSSAAELVWTPAAFFLFSGGGQFGSGWNMPLGKGLGITDFEKDQHGNPLVKEGDEENQIPPETEIFGNPFDGFVWSAWGAGTLQFDLGALIPGDWTHILFQTRQEFRYAAYSRAGRGQSWIFENDEGENQNGWNYYANYALGYTMPNSPLLKTIALMAELDKSLYTRGESEWGGDLGRWVFSTLFNFSVTPDFSVSTIIQMRTRRNYGQYNLYDEDYYYKELEIQHNNGRRHVLFYRAALILDYKLR